MNAIARVDANAGLTVAASEARSARACPVCGATRDRAKLFLEENIDAGKVNEFSFASRKAPEFMCHQLMQCQSCDVVYVDEPPSQAALAQAYHVADFDSSQEADDAAAAYLAAVAPTLARLPQRGRALEIGAGTGVFLDKLQGAGFSELVGVEPSRAAIDAAPSHRRAWLRESIFVEQDFEPASFDFICCFMTMEHVRDPMPLAQSVLRLLKPGGAFATVTHDYRSFVNRTLGKRSPIIDIEHMQLFSNASIIELFTRAGFSDVAARSFYNRYRLRYWLRLAPLPNALRNSVAAPLAAVGLADMRLSANVGNTIACGFRPR